MKLILSRKGFDSGNAGMASPIMTDGTPLSLPIPRDKGYCHSYDDLLAISVRPCHTFRLKPCHFERWCNYTKKLIMRF